MAAERSKIWRPALTFVESAGATSCAHRTAVEAQRPWMESCIGLASRDCFDQPQDVPAARCGICSLHPAQLGLFTRNVIQRGREHHEVVKSNKDIKFASRMLGTMRASRSRGSSRLCGKTSGGPGVFAAEIAVRRKRQSLAHRAQLAQQQGMRGEAETDRGEGERGGGIAETRTLTRNAEVRNQVVLT